MKKRKIAIVFGTRPEAIKMAPVILEFKKRQEIFETLVLVTAQHREMLDQVLSVFNIEPDYDLNIMKENQSLSDITANVLKGIEDIYKKERPDMVLVHGDTTTSFSAALAAYYQRIPIGHVEAGLRTYDHDNPFPEEGNRQLIDNLAELYFVPTETSKLNLINENKNESNIIVTGNTVIDAIHYTKQSQVKHSVLDLMDSKPKQKWLLLTMHRRENYGKPMSDVFEAVVKLTKRFSDIEFIMPVHLNPLVQIVAKEVLGDNSRIHLINPLEVDVFHQVINKSHLVLTDSGGMQEEAPALNKPVLVLRNKTERPEGLEAGTLKLIGTDSRTVYSSVSQLLTDAKEYNRMTEAINPYGDGTASEQIINKLTKYFEIED
ncbi:non-hydrolyzing UDP-N-acetylglucosamine 2-epimerase [Alkalibacterium thalassium]|uniref:UDP-N-acetylglucosamine 2-epimerase (non-hydrolyzing) n=1 Tax=Alkalibacterium thalassium TaxID=426701 RepID=A0A1G9BS44_9LACT|nr:UDP-N-acetylglucosamine 2-epimerase (non-hydrolyzing) [Alkalibacterium thalassium]SDK41994.1 UDP-N-acetylglucosamine 2-epimerase (non-hydrolysing) [Alkalibacterium thalassium]